MSNEKMREEFEAWYEGHCAPLESDRFKRDSDFPDDYDYFPAQEAWDGWQASRAALRVDMPRCWNDEQRDYRDDMVKSLNSSGVSYQ